MKTKKMVLTNIEANNIICNFAKYNQQENVMTMINRITEKSTLQTKWNILKNLQKVNKIKIAYNWEISKIQSDYEDNEHSTESIMKDEKGNPVKDEYGDEVKIRTVKPEYLSEFQKRHYNLMLQENEINFKLITIDDIEDANPSFADLEMLSFMIDDEDE